LAELQLVTLSFFDITEENSERIRSSYIEFVKTQDADLFKKATNNTKNVATRYEWLIEVKNIVEN
jgi:hypothetical protein